jgi:hypothetical protein
VPGVCCGGPALRGMVSPKNSSHCNPIAVYTFFLYLFLYLLVSLALFYVNLHSGSPAKHTIDCMLLRLKFHFITSSRAASFGPDAKHIYLDATLVPPTSPVFHAQAVQLSRLHAIHPRLFPLPAWDDRLPEGMRDSFSSFFFFSFFFFFFFFFFFLFCNRPPDQCRSGRVDACSARAAGCARDD